VAGGSTQAMMEDRAFRRYAECILGAGLHATASRLERHVASIFGGLELAGKRVLDVGGGAGLLTLYAAVRGAEGICLEPEAAGASRGAAARFGSLADALGVGSAVRLETMTFQEFRDDGAFDVIVMASSVNHLDEEACIDLARSEHARERYRRIFAKSFQLLRDGGALVITDCDRSNLFGDLGMSSPFCPTIEWHKHQHPRLWAGLLRSVGFVQDRYEWLPPNRLGRIGQVLLANRLAAYVLLSQFRLRARKPRSAA
jgi:SAM-dependent methyltransferase